MGPHSGPNKWLVAFTVMIPTFIEILDMTVVNVSLNHIQGDLSAGLDEVTWVLTSYLVSNAIVIPMSGWLASLIGRRRYLFLSIGLFTVSSFACGSATSLGMLVVFRILQGIGGGGLQPLSNAILLETFPARGTRDRHGDLRDGDRTCAHRWARSWGAGSRTTGPGGGSSTSMSPSASSRWHLPSCLSTIPPTSARKAGESTTGESVSSLWASVACRSCSTRARGSTGLHRRLFSAFPLISASALVLFVVTELRKPEPVVDLSVFRHRSFAAGNLIMFLGFFAFFASIVLLPIYVQKLMGYNAWWAGWVLAPGGIASFLMMPLTAKLMQKADARKLLFVGLLINVYALHLMSRFSLEADFDSIVWPRLVQGMGLGLFFVPLATLTVGRIPKEKMGNASAVFNLVRNLGGSFGVSVMTTQLARRSQFHHFRLTEQLTPYDPQFQEAIPRMMRWLDLHGGMGQASGPGPALGLIYGELNRQASMLAFNDAFFLDGLFFVVLPS